MEESKEVKKTNEVKKEPAKVITSITSLSDFELDSLKETANIGTGNASVALSALLNQKVNLGSPQTSVLSVNEVYGTLVKEKETFVGIYSKIKKGIEGNIVVLLPVSSAIKLISGVKNEEIKHSKESLDNKDLEVLEKLGSVLYSAYLNSLATFFEQKIVFKKPNIISAIGDAVVDFILVQIGKKEKVLLITLRFEIESPKVKGNFVLLFTLTSLSPLLESLKKKMGVA